MTPDPKPVKPIRLNSKALDNQNLAVYDRDGGQCVLCGKETLQAPHHIEHGTGNRSDELNNKVMLCYECHTAYHHGNDWAQHQLIERICTHWGFKRVIQIFFKGYIVYINEKRR